MKGTGHEMCSKFSEIYTLSVTFIGSLHSCNCLLITHNYITYIVCSKIHDFIVNNFVFLLTLVDCQVKKESVFIYALLFYILKMKITETKLRNF
jgi:hypothetical protein